jgi:photosystem II stability/assembly factor-like uncharacterized protein
MMTMKIHNLAFLLLFQFPFVCDGVLKISAPSPTMDKLQNTNRKPLCLIMDSIQLPVSKAAATTVDSQQVSNTNEAEVLNVVLKSTDGGQTWQDISEGLPKNVQGDGFFANDSGFYLSVEDGMYYSKSNSSAPSWEKEVFPAAHSSISPGKTGIVAYNYDGQFLQKINAASGWSPIYTNFPEKQVRTVFETTRDAVFIGCDKGLFRSTNNGKTWQLAHDGGWAMKMVESNGVLLATSQVGIIRSTDGGENWEAVISEGGVGIAVENIKGGFAAITYNTTSETRRVRTSYDGGKTWQPIDAGLPASLSIASIVQVGEDFFCGHPSGIFKSSDMGKTWQLLLPSIGNKVFNLSVSGDVIYAIPRDGGC